MAGDDLFKRSMEIGASTVGVSRAGSGAGAGARSQLPAAIRPPAGRTTRPKG